MSGGMESSTMSSTSEASRPTVAATLRAVSLLEPEATYLVDNSWIIAAVGSGRPSRGTRATVAWADCSGAVPATSAAVTAHTSAAVSTGAKNRERSTRPSDSRTQLTPPRDLGRLSSLGERGTR